MEPHVERMIAERNELLERTNKLRDFISFHPIFNTLPAEEQYDMRLQLYAMQMYGAILDNRISRATITKPA